MADIITNINTKMKIWIKPSYWLIDSFTLSMAREGCKKSIARLKEIEKHNEIIKRENKLTI